MRKERRHSFADVNTTALGASLIARSAGPVETMATRLGCRGAHPHRIPGVGTVYMPCDGGMPELIPKVARTFPLQTAGAAATIGFGIWVLTRWWRGRL